MSIVVDTAHRQGAFSLSAQFETGDGLTSLFGPSGSGKTTLVNIIAGLIRPDHGRVLIDGHCWLDTERGVFVPPHKRRLGYVFQEGRLFPHMTVRQNLNYGRWFAGRSRGGDGFGHVIELLGIAHLLDRRPTLLSGGEKQRVAIGRALMAAPRLLLMDEPLAALDAERKGEILPYIERLRDESGLPIIYVSHSVEEVSRLATSIVAMADGKVVATGSAAAILQRADAFPQAEHFEAGALVDATVARHLPEFGLSELACRVGTLRVPLADAPLRSKLRLRIRARDVMIATEMPDKLSALNILPGQIEALDDAEGAAVIVHISCNGEPLTARITRFSRDRLALVPGTPVYAVIKSVSFDRHTVFEAHGAADVEAKRDG